MMIGAWLQFLDPNINNFLGKPAEFFWLDFEAVSISILPKITEAAMWALGSGAIYGSVSGTK